MVDSEDDSMANGSEGEDLGARFFPNGPPAGALPPLGQNDSDIDWNDDNGSDGGNGGDGGSVGGGGNGGQGGGGSVGAGGGRGRGGSMGGGRGRGGGGRGSGGEGRGRGDGGGRGGGGGGRGGGGGGGGDGGGGGGGGGGDGNGRGRDRQEDGVRQPPRVQDRRDPYAPFKELDTANIEVLGNPQVRRKVSRYLASRTIEDNLVTLQELITNPDGNFNNKFMFAVFLNVHRNPHGGRPSHLVNKRGGVQRNTQEVNYTRLLRFADLNCPPGANTFVIMEGMGHAGALFDEDPPLRDDGTIHPSQWFMFRNPPGMENFMGGLEPIMPYHKPITAIRGNIKVPEVLPQATPNISAACVHGLVASVSQIQASDTGCGGGFCDKQGIISNGQVKRHCACYTNNSRLGKYVVALDIKFTRIGMNPITIKEFTSESFQKTYLFEGNLPPGIGAAIFADWEVEDLLYETVKNVLEKVNDNGGWSVLMWSKQGRILDAAANPDGHNAHPNVERAYVNNGIVINHLVKMFPSEPEKVNPAEMQALKMNLSTLFTTFNRSDA